MGVRKVLQCNLGFRGDTVTVLMERDDGTDMADMGVEFIVVWNTIKVTGYRLRISLFRRAECYLRV